MQGSRAPRVPWLPALTRGLPSHPCLGSLTQAGWTSQRAVPENETLPSTPAGRAVKTETAFIDGSAGAASSTSRSPPCPGSGACVMRYCPRVPLPLLDAENQTRVPMRGEEVAPLPWQGTFITNPSEGQALRHSRVSCCFACVWFGSQLRCFQSNFLLLHLRGSR